MSLSRIQEAEYPNIQGHIKIAPFPRNADICHKTQNEPAEKKTKNTKKYIHISICDERIMRVCIIIAITLN